jgi:hypothetical protein
MTALPSPRPCASCGEETEPSKVGWECDCGVVVCSEAGCFEEYFKHVAGGEATRCFTCGTVN